MKLNINMRTRGANTRCTDVVPESETLPAEINTGGSVGCAVVLFLLGAASLAGALFLVVAKGNRGEGWIIGLVAALMGHVLFEVLAVLALRYRENWTLTATSVQRRWRRLGGWKEWSEPLSAYAGVLMYDVYHSGGDKSPSYTEYILDLHHADDKKKTLRLWCCRSHEMHRSEWERYARLLDLPALAKTKDGVERREVDDLDKSVRERVAEGAMEVTFDSSAPPPGDKLGVSVDGDGLLITTRKGSLGPATKTLPVVFGLMACGLIVGGMFAPRPLEIVLPVVGFIFLLIAIGIGFVARMIGQYLKVSASGVRIWWTHPWGRFAEKTLPSDEIEDVVVRTPPGSQGFKAVLIMTDNDVGWWGMGLKEEELEWVRDCIVAVISAQGRGLS